MSSLDNKVDNTGNISIINEYINCYLGVWPSEEILAYYLH
jgi:hypothetical protein